MEIPQGWEALLFSNEGRWHVELTREDEQFKYVVMGVGDSEEEAIKQAVEATGVQRGS